MPPSTATYDLPSDAPSSVIREDGIEYDLLGKLQGLKYEFHRDITDRATLEQNFREKFEALNRLHLTNAEFTRLLDEIVTPDVFTASKTLRSNYMVLLAGEQKLMITRPCQVYAVQHMAKCIDDDDGNGFVWHTTGSSKTLTAFKASTLLKENDQIHKCVFVMDGKRPKSKEDTKS